MARTIYTFDNKVVKILDRLARKGSTNKNEILRRAITLYDYLFTESKDGRIKFEKSDGTIVELIL